MLFGTYCRNTNQSHIWKILSGHCGGIFCYNRTGVKAHTSRGRNCAVPMFDVTKFKTDNNTNLVTCQSNEPGLVVMGGDSRPRGCGFESQHRILDGHFFTMLL